MRNRYWMAALSVALAATAGAFSLGGAEAKTQEVPVEVSRPPISDPVGGVNGGLTNSLNNGLNSGLNSGLGTSLGSTGSFSGSVGTSSSSGSRESMTPEELARQLASDRRDDLRRLPIVDKLHRLTRR
jgi:opacity protein-like surface antigen